VRRSDFEAFLATGATAEAEAVGTTGLPPRMMFSELGEALTGSSAALANVMTARQWFRR
jgi:hypothetical protein